MEQRNDKIVFTTLDNEEIEFCVIEQTMINGNNYLLVAADNDEEEADAMILKEVNFDDDNIVYEEIDDIVELEAVAKVFSELVDDFDIEME